MRGQLNELASTIILISILVGAAVVVVWEYVDHTKGESQENDGPVREILEQVIEGHLGIDLDIGEEDVSS